MVLSLEDVGLVSVIVSFMVVCLNILLNMGVFKTMFIIAGSILLFVLKRDGRLPQEFVNGVNDYGNLFISNMMKWVADLRERIFANDDTWDNTNPQNDTDNEIDSNTSLNESNREILEDKDIEECTMEELIGEGLVPEAAKTTLQLISEGFGKADSIKAAIECGSLEVARIYLQKSCNMCHEVSPVYEIISMVMCTDNICKKCLKGHFESVIKRESLDLSCPVCHLPDLDGDEEIVHFHRSCLLAVLEKVLDKDLFSDLQIRMVRNAL